MSRIVLFDNACQIVEEPDDDFMSQLDRHLSFMVPGAEFSKAFRGYINDRGEEVTWDGRRHLMTGKGRFPAGLLPRVQRFYDRRNKEVELVDRRNVLSVGNPVDIVPTLKGMGKEPYPFQAETVLKAKDKQRGIIRIATGGGKTLVAALLAATLGKSTIIYVIGRDLLYQIHGLFSKLFDEEIGLIGDGKCDIRDINVATIWSVGQALGMKKKGVTLDDEDGSEKKIDPAKFRAIKGMLLDAKVHILDECHLAACDTVQTISRHIKAEYVYGMSASPWRDDNADLLIEAFLGERIVEIPARQLIEQGYLVKPVIRFLAPPKWEKSKRKYPTIYSEYLVKNEQRNGMVLKGATKLVEQGYQTLVLFHSLNHGKILHKMISKEIPCALLSGKDSSKKRQKVKDSLEAGEINCIIASKIFDIGIDLPTLSGLVVAGGGKSSVRALQRIGRVIRRSPGKVQSAVIDFADQAPYLLDHAEKRRDIYSEEFDVSWPLRKESGRKDNSAG
jgi:superfamily II DNA or RNA helicase